MSKKVEIYTDGGCHGNPGPGAWAFVVASDTEGHTESGYSDSTTNNRMELLAVINALEWCSNMAKGCPIVIHTDSQYVKNGITTWIHSWLKNNWKTSGKKPVKNQSLWIQLHQLNSNLDVQWEWVKGHAGDHYNEIVDGLVQQTLKSRA